MKTKIMLFLIALLFLFNLNLPSVSAQEISLTPTPTPAVLEYQLPYPGILPGHPFYFFKNFRDKIWGLLISNPLKKAEFDLLQADKNLQATVYLSEQNKESKVIFETLQKSEGYFTSSIANAQEAKKQGIYTVDFSAKITIANLKYQEVVSGLSKSAKGDDKKKFEVELKNLKNLGKKAQALNPK